MCIHFNSITPGAIRTSMTDSIELVNYEGQQSFCARIVLSLKRNPITAVAAELQCQYLIIVIVAPTVKITFAA